MRQHEAEIEALGLRVAVISFESQAVAAGYDELTHLNFVVMESMPKAVIDLIAPRTLSPFL